MGAALGWRPNCSSSTSGCTEPLRAFGVGIPSREFRVALTERLARTPEFRLDPDAPVTWYKGTVRGPRELPPVLSA